MITISDILKFYDMESINGVIERKIIVKTLNYIDEFNKRTLSIDDAIILLDEFAKDDTLDIFIRDLFISAKKKGMNIYSMRNDLESILK